MIIFILSAFGFIALALLFIMLPLLGWGMRNKYLDGDQINLAIFRQQLDELARDRANGALDQDHYEAARCDFERTLLSDIPDPVVITHTKSGRWLAPLLALVVPLLAAGIYLKVGDYRAIEGLSDESVVDQTIEHHDVQALDELLARLAKHMQTHPDDLKGWMMLGHSALVLGHEQQAVDAYAQAVRLAPKEPEVMLDYAEALAQMAKEFNGKPIELIETALAIDPSSPHALWLMGMAEVKRGNSAQALVYWSKLEAQLPHDSEEAKSLHQLLEETRHGQNSVSNTKTPMK